MFSVHVIAAIVSELSMQGIEASAALDGTGLAESQLEIHATKSSYGQLDLVMRNALALSNDTAIALRSGRRMARYEPFSILPPKIPDGGFSSVRLQSWPIR